MGASFPEGIPDVPETIGFPQKWGVDTTPTYMQTLLTAVSCLVSGMVIG